MRVRGGDKEMKIGIVINIVMEDDTGLRTMTSQQSHKFTFQKGDGLIDPELAGSTVLKVGQTLMEKLVEMDYQMSTHREGDADART
jgi:hypothetical protein